MEKIEHIITNIEKEIAILDKIIEREDGSYRCAQHFRGERYALFYIKDQLNDVIRGVEQ
jgi:hypothetical protein